ncbi:cysteine desulfurase [Catenibacillus scindens]|uniref:Cysteine desulfurase n=1 Tax=Catenibacillus scindens TaxID=673271 RepID=A0A7W8HA74_9FIRM|nr:cysteine desulfurase family protein [Catenibacillus scindens]MBB5264525.1 cysteine desulfurase [Catenibacillus scindens]
MEIYLDNAATTRAYESVCQIMVKTMRQDYGNPSALHMKGVEAEHYVKNARQYIARTLKIGEKELIFTSGGTESNNMAIIGGAMANCRAGKHLITTGIEHASVYNPMMYLESQGYEVTYLPVDSTGTVRLDALEKAIREDTILVSVMCVNNEIGTIQPLDKIGRLIKEKNPKTLFHVDAIQGFGKMRLWPSKLGIDLLSASGHKLHGPKGVGFLYIKDRVKVHPLILGGGQQKDMRSGTENVPGIAGFGQAVEEVFENLEEKLDQLYSLRDYFIQRVCELDGVVINGFTHRQEGFFGPAPHIVSVSFADIRAEVLLHALEEKKIYVSSGSACSSNHPAISGTLKAIGVEKKYLDATLRFSFSFDTTQKDIDDCIDALKSIVPVLRRFTPGGRR